MELVISADGLCRYCGRAGEVRAVDMCSTLKSTKEPYEGDYRSD